MHQVLAAAEAADVASTDSGKSAAPQSSSPAPPPTPRCNNPGCPRSSCNDKDDAQCCALCTETNGKEHGPLCEYNFFIRPAVRLNTRTHGLAQQRLRALYENKHVSEEEFGVERQAVQARYNNERRTARAPSDVAQDDMAEGTGAES